MAHSIALGTSAIDGIFNHLVTHGSDPQPGRVKAQREPFNWNEFRALSATSSEAQSSIPAMIYLQHVEPSRWFTDHPLLSSLPRVPMALGSGVPIKLTIRHTLRANITLMIYPWTTIGSIKVTIQQIYGYQLDTQHLLYGNEKLENFRTAQESGIIANSILTLRIRLTIEAKFMDGKRVIITGFGNITILDIKTVFQKVGHVPIAKQRFVFDGEELKDDKTLEDYKLEPGHNFWMFPKLFKAGHVRQISILEVHLDPKYDFDFTNVDSTGRKFKRGGLPYKRPEGWQRFALKVKDQYDAGDNTWIGQINASGEWPVSYHGTAYENAKAIAGEGLKLEKGVRFNYGYGIYSTPDIVIAEQYATPFNAKDGKTYKVVFQNRVNPATVQKIGDYWLSPKDEDLRQYGVCIKEVTGG